MASIKVLLADDDADDRSLFSEALAEAVPHAELTTVEDGQQLMNFLDEIQQPPPPHIIFLDINMPRKTGDVCLKEIRSNKKFKDVPIIMFSTSAHLSDIDESYEEGANMYVSKSTFFDDDVTILKNLLSLNWKDYLPKPSKNKFVFKQ